MRIAGRGEDGTAKGIRTDDDGKVVLSRKPVELLRQPTPADGLAISQGSSVQMDYLDVTDIDSLLITTRPSANNSYTVEIVEYYHFNIGNENAVKTHKMSRMTGRQTFNIELSGLGNKIRVRVYNHDTTAFNIGLTITENKINTNEYYDTETQTFKQQGQIATVGKVDEVINTIGTRQIMIQPVSSNGFQVLVGNSNETVYLDVVNLDRVTIGTAVSNATPYRIEVLEYNVISGGSVTHVVTHRLSDVDLTGAQTLEVKLTGKSNRIKIKVANRGSESFWIGLNVDGKHSKSLEYYDTANRTFKAQEQIATEKTLNELLRTMLGFNVTKEAKRPPTLENVTITNSGPIKQIVGSHDGVVYGAGKTLGELYTSTDGNNWTLLHTFTTGSGVTMCLVGDTGHLVVGFFNGDVFISDEDGVFSETPSFQTGSITHNFGRFKHGNVLGFNTYEAHGFTDGQKHEAFISTDNGKTFKKVMDSARLQALLTQYPDFLGNRIHLHDIEYDPYSGRLYLWQGDFDARTFYYSDDWGDTWDMAFPRGAAGNATNIIATPTGIAFGGDTEGGGVGYLRLDRSSNIKPALTIENYENEHFKFNNDGGRFISTRKFVDRTKGIYLLPYIVEFDDDDVRNAYLAYSDNGKDWQIIWQTPDTGHATGLESIDLVGDLLVGTYSIKRDYYVFTAKINLPN